MAKAQFHKNQRVYVKPVGTWALIERVVPHWAKGIDEPIRIHYDVGLGREFAAEELLSEEPVSEKAVVGVAEVVKTAYPDPTAKGEDWSAVDLTPKRRLRYPASLETIKGAPELSKMALVRKSRLSVTPVTAGEFKKVLSLGERGTV